MRGGGGGRCLEGGVGGGEGIVGGCFTKISFHKVFVTVGFRLISNTNNKFQLIEIIILCSIM